MPAIQVNKVVGGKVIGKRRAAEEERHLAPLAPKINISL
jgi:hypothetical protein